MKKQIRRGTSADFSALSALWRRSVEATHDFLSQSDMDAIHAELEPMYFPAVELWIIEDDQGLCGFMGLDGCRVEMLFLEPSRRHQGIGRCLLDHARTLHASLEVDVNEQNPAAWGFYRHYGFQVTGRSERDGQGRPFPLIHMTRAPQDPSDGERC